MVEQILYGLICTKCGTLFESRTTLDELALELESTKCTECGGDLRRDWGCGLVKFNGSGFTRGSA